MSRFALSLVATGLVAAGLLAATRAQDPPQWRPPDAEMPRMPLVAELDGDWSGSLGTWLRGIDRVSGASLAEVRANGTAKRGTKQTQIVRFTHGVVPVAVWTDRSGDGRADMIEIYRSGRVAIQVIDADYSGRANVMRVYDTAGSLVREERL